MLNLDDRKILGMSPLARQVLGMVVAGDHGGLEVEQLGESPTRFLPSVHHRRAFHVADMLRHECAIVSNAREGVLLLGASRKQLGRIFRARYVQRRGCVAAGAANELDHFTSWPAVENANDRIVVAALDGAVVHDERIGDLSEALEGRRLVDDDRLVVDIARRHDEHAPKSCKSRCWRGSRGQHHAKLR